MGEGGWKGAFRRTTVVRIFAFRFQNRILEMMEAGRQSVEKTSAGQSDCVEGSTQRRRFTDQLAKEGQAVVDCGNHDRRNREQNIAWGKDEYLGGRLIGPLDPSSRSPRM